MCILPTEHLFSYRNIFQLIIHLRSEYLPRMQKRAAMFIHVENIYVQYIESFHVLIGLLFGLFTNYSYFVESQWDDALLGFVECYFPELLVQICSYYCFHLCPSLSLSSHFIFSANDTKHFAHSLPFFFFFISCWFRYYWNLVEMELVVNNTMEK